MDAAINLDGYEFEASGSQTCDSIFLPLCS